MWLIINGIVYWKGKIIKCMLSINLLSCSLVCWIRTIRLQILTADLGFQNSDKMTISRLKIGGWFLWTRILVTLFKLNSKRSQKSKFLQLAQVYFTGENNYNFLSPMLAVCYLFFFSSKLVIFNLF